MAIILNINKDLSIKKISKDYELISEKGQYSKEERKEIISKYVLRDDYNDSLNIKKELADEYVGKDQDSDGTAVIDKIINGFHLKLLDDPTYLVNEFGYGFFTNMNKEAENRCGSLSDIPLTASYLNYLAKESGLKDFNQYSRYKKSEKDLESKLRERIKC